MLNMLIYLIHKENIVLILKYNQKILQFFFNFSVRNLIFVCLY
jgi:hypothetical protein